MARSLGSDLSGQMRPVLEPFRSQTPLASFPTGQSMLWRTSLDCMEGSSEVAPPEHAILVTGIKGFALRLSTRALLTSLHLTPEKVRRR